MKMSNQLSILKNSRPETLVFILERESSYVAAVILSCLDKNAATQVLELLNPKFVDEIFQCMNTIGPISKKHFTILEETLNHELKETMEEEIILTNHQF
jgi:flagellar motor switch protein FliG